MSGTLYESDGKCYGCRHHGEIDVLTMIQKQFLQLEKLVLRSSGSLTYVTALLDLFLWVETGKQGKANDVQVPERFFLQQFLNYLTHPCQTDQPTVV